MKFNDGKIWEPLKVWGLFFCHLNVNGLLSKNDKIKDIINYIKPAILGIKESKLDSFVTNAELNINSYRLIRINRNRNDGVVACYIRNDLCFDINIFFSSNSIKHDFFEISNPKS